MKLSLGFGQQMALINAYGALDSYEVVTPGVEKGAQVVSVRYKFGAARRLLVKNVNALKTSINSFEETRAEIFKECFPNAEEGSTIQSADMPVEFAKYQSEFEKLDNQLKSEEIDLEPLPLAVMYNDENQFPVAALSELEQHGLIA